MKERLFLAFVVLLCRNAADAAPFRNLEFEDAKTNDVFFIDQSSGVGATIDLLPGWKLFRGGVLQTNVYFNGRPVSSGFASLIDRNQAPAFVEGSYALVLAGDSF
jgi:hypothetical protein